MRILFHFGRYFLLLKDVFGRPERFRIYWRRTLEEMDLLGVQSPGIVALLSAFMGRSVITIQTKTNIDSPDPGLGGGFRHPAERDPAEFSPRSSP